jgi:hypothetical protein
VSEGVSCCQLKSEKMNRETVNLSISLVANLGVKTCDFVSGSGAGTTSRCSVTRGEL